VSADDLLIDDTLTLAERHVWRPFTQAQTAAPPIPVARAYGCTLEAEDGRTYIDLMSSWWVNLHGHANPVIAEAIAQQAHTLEQVIFADFTHAPAAKLAARLAGVLPGDLARVFYSDDGSTAVEVALKLSRQYWLNKGQAKRSRILALDGGYHGDTVGAMSAGVGSGFYEPFAPWLFPVDRLPYPATWDGDTEVEAKEAAALAWLDDWITRYGDEVAAFIAEPLVQGASGMRFCRPEFLRRAVEKLRAAGALIIFDEVMTGFGRLGTLFAAEQTGIAPDVICLSKGLTGGFLPLSATVTTQAVYEAFLDGSFDRAFAHGHSFTANPLGCAAALASLDLTLSPGCVAARAAIEARHRRGIAELSAHPKLTRGRVLGTVAAIEVKEGAAYGGELSRRLKSRFLERGLLIRPLGSVLYLLPPYCIGEEELDQAYAALASAADDVL
jgi:adenosylmethionine---8-amino-7-oxononanoate aminotransferase